MNNLVVDNVSKNYGIIKALENISFEVDQGEVFGLIGPDGAGKTTLFRILTTLLLASEGSAKVCGYDVVTHYRQIRKICGYMPGRFSLYQDLTVEENLNFFASLFNATIASNYDLIRDIYIQIEPFKDRRASKLSGGMKQKLALCCALIHRPKILFLDEPTTGVDPVSRKEFWDMLGMLKREGITILVSTPYMDEAERCDRMALMREGELLVTDRPANIRSSYDKQLFSVTGEAMYPLLKVVREWEGTDSCYAFGDAHHLTINSSYQIDQLHSFLQNKGCCNVDIKSIEPTIEDCFMTLTR